MKLRDIQVGDKFIFRNKTYKKTSDLGEFIGFCNCEDENGKSCHIHPSTEIEKEN